MNSRTYKYHFLLLLNFCSIIAIGQANNDISCEEIIDNCIINYIQENEACRQWEGDCSETGDIYRMGNVVIGGTASVDGYVLTVDGKTITEQFKVDVAAWPDYVFSEDYPLVSLEEVDAYIQKNGHLPKTQEESKILKEGIQLGDMTVLQQEKIEEIYLHLIQLQKETALLESILAESKK